MDFMLDLITMIAKLATDSELNGVKTAIRATTSIAQEHYRQLFDILSLR